MKYIVVTGANGGIGNATARLLLKNGYEVIGVDLFESDINDKHYHHICCDLSNSSSIEECKALIKKMTNEIYMIYNLAGIFKLQTMIEGSEEDLRKILEVNFFGAYKINRSLYPLLTKNSRILMFTSEVARYSPQPFNGYYALSKIIVDKYADILRRELNYVGIKVIKVQSGAIKTKLLDGVNHEYETTLSKTNCYKKPLIKLKKLMDDEIKKQVSPDLMAKKIVKLADKKHTKINYKIKNSFKLRFLNSLPEKLQDFIYSSVIK
ncbi:MAG: SDR family NAD(P)-dependent oxidoreductase [Bacilli bacterium]|nr:SDR family NAD(P)-dependent oxidoreductase [Bacilli bacterium]